VHGFVFEPLTSLETIVERYGQTHVIIGNADTRILLFGTKDDIRSRSRALHVHGPRLSRLLHGRRQPHAAEYAGGECVVLQ
jgi:uroporphyrinogen-III decarboxylase